MRGKGLTAGRQSSHLSIMSRFAPCCLCCSCMSSPAGSLSRWKPKLWGRPRRALPILTCNFTVTWCDKSSTFSPEALWQGQRDTNWANWLLPAQAHLQLSPTFSCHMWQTAACRKQALLFSRIENIRVSHLLLYLFILVSVWDLWVLWVARLTASPWWQQTRGDTDLRNSWQ